MVEGEVSKLIGVVLCALVVTGPAYATLNRNVGLEQKAQQVRGSHVDIWCENDQAEWNSNQPAAAKAVTFFQYQATVLAPSECADLAAPVHSEQYDVAVYIVMHELMHTAGIANEAQAECMNLFLFRYELRKWWGYTAAEAQAAFTRGLAAHLAMPAAYQGCNPVAVDTVSVANGL